jgi:hypothetical protein
MIMSAHEDHLSWEGLKTELAALLRALDEADFDRVREILQEAVSGYAPEGEIVDWLHLQQHRGGKD